VPSATVNGDDDGCANDAVNVTGDVPLNVEI